ncbi:hypothetical protein H9Y04_16260 [Streptomyces sp. TRM66268-LWL]|uniref:Secreted protein n=1 Tax=Streptomyces polyasparticus TaxID=2767826 RepID=A0ABR7SI14_9ACTN|nr:hypothetical protein [Streptomyces polyasparticus]MBC9714116.1 hypothetical protein [Streptomyces polyasparticus]
MNHTSARVALVTAGLLLSAAATGAAAADEPDTEQAPTLTALATTRSVTVHEEFRVGGKAAAFPAGTEVTLQQWQRKGWVSLPAQVRTKKDGTYSMRVRLGMKGPNSLRVIACTAPESDAYTMLNSPPECTASQPLRVTVR